MTFRVMNKVMNNLKNLSNSIVIQSVNENVTHPFRPKNSKNPAVQRFRVFLSNHYNVCSMCFAFDLEN